MNVGRKTFEVAIQERLVDGEQRCGALHKPSTTHKQLVMNRQAPLPFQQAKNHHNNILTGNPMANVEKWRCRRGLTRKEPAAGFIAAMYWQSLMFLSDSLWRSYQWP